jgi:hypothetical protein
MAEGKYSLERFSLRWKIPAAPKIYTATGCFGGKKIFRGQETEMIIVVSKSDEMSEIEISETATSKAIDEEEYKLEVNGYRCPEEYARQFTPLEFEEVTAEEYSRSAPSMSHLSLVSGEFPRI